MSNRVSLGLIGFGILLIVIGVGAFFYFDSLEEFGGGGSRHYRIVTFIYMVFGKIGVLALCTGIGAITTIVGIKRLKSDE